MAAEILVLPDAEAACIDELRVKLDTIPEWNGTPAGTRIPDEPKPDDFIRVTRVGGVRRDLVNDLHTLVVEAFSTREKRAERLCALGVGILEAAARDGWIGSVIAPGRFGIFALPANLPDPAVPTHYRYTSTISATLRRVTT